MSDPRRCPCVDLTLSAESLERLDDAELAQIRAAIELIKAAQAAPPRFSTINGARRGYAT